jgi:4-hydroxy-3-polyprenylbenzoate decarboxylase
MNSIAFRLACQLGIDATKKLPGEGFKRPWPPLIKMDEAVKAKVEKIMANQNASRIQAASPQ